MQLLLPTAAVKRAKARETCRRVRSQEWGWGANRIHLSGYSLEGRPGNEKFASSKMVQMHLERSSLHDGIFNLYRQQQRPLSEGSKLLEALCSNNELITYYKMTWQHKRFFVPLYVHLFLLFSPQDKI